MTCSGPLNTLTYSCGGVCDDYSPCVVYDSSDSSCSDCVEDSSGDCQYHCFPFMGGNPYWAFLVEFGSYESDQEIAARASDSTFDNQVAALEDDAVDYWHYSNDDLTSISDLDIPPVVEIVIIAGGSSTNASDYIRGKVADVSFGTDLVSSYPYVTEVGLMSLNLEDQEDNIASLIAPNVKYLRLSNDLLDSIPTGLSDFTELRTLWLDTNYITQVTSSDGIGSIVALNLTRNGLTSFEGIFPNLEWLDLSYNSLDSFPPSIFEHTSLNNLNMTGNIFSSATFTAEESVFLQSISILTLFQSDFSEPLTCSSDETIVISADLSVCVTSASNFQSPSGSSTDSSTSSSFSSSGSSSKAPAPSPSSSSSLSSPPIALMIGCIVGAIVVLILLAVLVCCLCRRKRQNQEETSPVGFNACNEGHYHNTSPRANHFNDRGLLQKPSEEMPQRFHQQSVFAESRQHGQPKNGKYYPEVGGRESNRSSSTDTTTITAGSSLHRSSKRSNRAGGENPAAVAKQWHLIETSNPALKMLDEKCVNDVRKIGSGGFCDVWLVSYKDMGMFAAKRLKPGCSKPIDQQAFVAELILVSSISHPNIVRFLGAAAVPSRPGELQGLFEYATRGDLRDYLAQTASQKSSWTHEKLQIAMDVAAALTYVHGLSPPLVHRDLKSRNVVLSNHLRAKLTDFGVARAQSINNTMTACVGTGRWLAPEVINGSGDYDQLADMYSFGVLLYELDSHEIPYLNVTTRDGRPMLDVAILHQVALGTLRPKLSSHSPREMSALADRCLSFARKQRPTAEEVFEVLTEIESNMFSYVV